MKHTFPVELYPQDWRIKALYLCLKKAGPLCPSICFSVCKSVCLVTCLMGYLSVCLPCYLAIHSRKSECIFLGGGVIENRCTRISQFNEFVSLSVCMPVCLPVGLIVRCLSLLVLSFCISPLSDRSSISLSFCLPVDLSVYISLYLPLGFVVCRCL